MRHQAAKCIHDAWRFHLGDLSPAQVIRADGHGWMYTYRAGETPTQSLAQLRNDLASVHLKDSHLLHDRPGTWTDCLLGEGDMLSHTICLLLTQEGYNGYLSLGYCQLICQSVSYSHNCRLRPA